MADISTNTLKVGDLLFAHISHGGLFEFRVESVTTATHDVTHVVVSGHNKWTDASVVLLCVLDNGALEIFKVLQQTGADSSHWYLRGDRTRLYTNPLQACTDSVRKGIKALETDLANKRREYKNHLSSIEQQIAAFKAGLEEQEFLLGYAKKYGLKTASFPVKFLEESGKLSD
jgi:hypothetical protein